MKSIIRIKVIFITLSVPIIIAGAFHFAMADVAYPDGNTSGTAAIANQINPNFNAINTRQTATAATIAGVYKMQMLQITVENVDKEYHHETCSCAVHNHSITVRETCSVLTQGTITLTAAGLVASFVGSSYNNCYAETSPSNVTGTFTVNSDGSGTIALGAPAPVIYYKASKDLNTVMLTTGASDGNVLGIALRQ